MSVKIVKNKQNHKTKLMNSLKKLDKILFLDIETVPQFPKFEVLNGRMQQLWTKKAKQLFPNQEIDMAEVYPRAGIYAEFGKIVCISTAFFHNDKLRVKSFASENEFELLSDFAKLLNEHFSDSESKLCGHNSKEFDIPYIARRMLINKIALPSILDLSNKKPWEVNHLDTMQMWKFGDYKNYTSLDLLTAIFDIPSPKDDIDGSEVWNVYWNQKDLKRITEYCQKDTISVVRIYQAMSGLEMIDDENIIFV